MKSDENGNILWNHFFEETAECYVVQQTMDGGYILGGYGDYNLIKTDSLGNVLWRRSFEDLLSMDIYSIVPLEDGGYILAGGTWLSSGDALDVMLVKIDSEGHAVWSQVCGGDGSDICYAVQPTLDGGYILAGKTESFGNGSRNKPDFWLVKMGSESDTNPFQKLVPIAYALYQNYPNPFNPSSQIAYCLANRGRVSLKIFDVLGREVQVLVDGAQNAGNHVATFDGSGLATGLYFYRLQTGKFSETKKMVLLK
ncbi:T9SS type A sorting domain-containing protein [bacterium]|nr:T9SS type A sorting domain-containing protein [bacterium]